MTVALTAPKKPMFKIGDVILWVCTHKHVMLPETIYTCVTCETERTIKFPSYTIWGIYGPHKIIATITTKTSEGKTVTYQVDDQVEGSFLCSTILKEDYIFPDIDSTIVRIKQANEEWKGELNRLQKLTLPNIKLPEEYYDGRRRA